MQQIGPRLDPAPSRWSYRMQRLMLTPLYRNLLRIGLPFAIAFGSMTIYMSDDTRREAVVTSVTDLRDQFQSRPEFMVNLMAIDGASTTVAEDIREILPLDFPVSSFDLELEDDPDHHPRLARRGRCAGAHPLGRILAGRCDGTAAGRALAHGRGPRGAGRRRDDRPAPPPRARNLPTLPLIAGEGADEHVTEALDLVRAAGPLGARLRGLVRIGERRWDVVLDRDQRILLPEDAPVQALERVIALDQVAGHAGAGSGRGRHASFGAPDNPDEPCRGRTVAGIAGNQRRDSRTMIELYRQPAGHAEHAPRRHATRRGGHSGCGQFQDRLPGAALRRRRPRCRDRGHRLDGGAGGVPGDRGRHDPLARGALRRDRRHAGNRARDPHRRAGGAEDGQYPGRSRDRLFLGRRSAQLWAGRGHRP